MKDFGCRESAVIINTKDLSDSLIVKEILKLTQNIIELEQSSGTLSSSTNQIKPNLINRNELVEKVIQHLPNYWNKSKDSSIRVLITKIIDDLKCTAEHQ